MTRYAMLNTGNGVGYMDLKTLLEDKRAIPNQIPITNAVVGLNHQIRFSQDSNTLVFMKGVDSGLRIIPMVHLNLLPLQKMKKRSEYVFTAELDDKFVALDYDSYIHTWDKQTGRFLKSEGS